MVSVLCHYFLARPCISSLILAPSLIWGEKHGIRAMVVCSKYFFIIIPRHWLETCVSRPNHEEFKTITKYLWYFVIIQIGMYMPFPLLENNVQSKVQCTLTFSKALVRSPKKDKLFYKTLTKSSSSFNVETSEELSCLSEMLPEYY